MTKIRHLRTIGVAVAVAVGAALLAAAPAEAAQWPERPVTLIVPWSAGGGTDATARILARLLEEQLGKPFPVVNRTGGGGVVGHTEIANARPDGYTLGVITTELSMYRHQGLTSLSYADIVPIAQYNSDSPGLIVRADAPYKTARELLDAIRANPGKLKASGANQGGLLHLAMVGMLKAAGLDPASVKWVPTQGGAQGLAELTSGGVDFVTNNLSDAKALIAAGEVRPLATMATERHRDFRDVPTLEEATGVDWTIANWRGVAGPKGLPQEVVARLGQAIEQVCRSEEFRSFMDKRGYTVACLGPDAFGAALATKQAQFGEAMKAAGLIH
jgi:tripartite-type tricarboxylate transporter receptor subunit TctC